MDNSFDRVEDLARCMCESAGRGWNEGSMAAREYWRNEAARALAKVEAVPAPDVSAGWLCVCLSGWLVAGLALLWVGATP